MTEKQRLMKALGEPFITRAKLAKKLDYADAKSVDEILYGLPRIHKSRYYTEDVADRLLSEGIE